MKQVNVDKELMRNFFLDKLSEGNFSPKGVDFNWWPNSVDNIFVNNLSPYLNVHPALSLYESMVFCVYSGAAFGELLEYSAANYDYFHCTLYDSLFGSFCKLTNYLKSKRSGIYKIEIESQFSQNAINLYEYLYKIVSQFFSSLGIQDLPVMRNTDGSLSDGFFAIINKQQVFQDLDSIGGNLYNVGRALRTGQRSWSGISHEQIVPISLCSAIKIRKIAFQNNMFFDISQHNMVHTHGDIGTCPYCGSRSISTYADGTAECDSCGRSFRYC